MDGVVDAEDFEGLVGVDAQRVGVGLQADGAVAGFDLQALAAIPRLVGVKAQGAAGDAAVGGLGAVLEVVLDDGAVGLGGVVQAAGGGGEDGGGRGVEVDDGLIESFDGVAFAAAAGLVFEGALAVDVIGVGLVEAVGVVGPGLVVVGGDAVGGGALGEARGKFAGLFELGDGLGAVHLGAGDVLALAHSGAGGEEETLGRADDAPAIGFEFKAGAAPVAAIAGVRGLMDDVAGVVLALLALGFKLQATLAGGVVEDEPGVVLAV